MLPEKYMVVSESQPKNAFLPMVVKLRGRVMLSRLLQSEKAELFKTVTPSGMLMLLSAEHFLNAAKPTSFTELGTVIPVIKSQPLNAPVPIAVSG